MRAPAVHGLRCRLLVGGGACRARPCGAGGLRVLARAGDGFRSGRFSEYGRVLGTALGWVGWGTGACWAWLAVQVVCRCGRVLDTTCGVGGLRYWRVLGPAFGAGIYQVRACAGHGMRCGWFVVACCARNFDVVLISGKNHYATLFSADASAYLPFTLSALGDSSVEYGGVCVYCMCVIKGVLSIAVL